MTESTTSVLLEAANFEPDTIFWNSERHGFGPGLESLGEGVDPYLAERCAGSPTRLLVDVAGARWVRRHRRQGDLPEPPVRPVPAGANRPPRDRDPRTSSTQSCEASGSRSWGGGSSCHLAGARRDARDRPRRGGRALPADREMPFRLPRRRAMFGRLSKASACAADPGRTRRLRVLGGVHLEPAAADPEPGAVGSTCRSRASRRSWDVAPGRPRRRGRAQPRRGERGDRALRVAHVYLPTGSSFPTSTGTSRGIDEGGFPRAKGVVEGLYEALGIEPVFERPRAFLRPGRRRRVEGAGCSRSRPGAARRLGRVELDVDDARRAGARPVVYEDVVSYPAGTRSSRSAWPRRCLRAISSPRPRGRRARAARDAALRRLPRRAHPEPGQKSVACASSSGRRSGRCRTRTPAPSGSASLRPSARSSMPSSARRAPDGMMAWLLILLGALSG